MLAVSFKYIDTRTASFVVFTTRMVVSLPGGSESTRVAHGSPPELPEVVLTGATVGAAAAVSSVAEVGKGKGVSVGRGVCVGVSVGDMGVFVGMAA